MVELPAERVLSEVVNEIEAKRVLREIERRKREREVNKPLNWKEIGF